MDHQVHNHVSLLSLDNQLNVSWSILSLNIESAEKIGTVGRTGAEKSSFIPTLFRMVILGLDQSGDYSDAEIWLALEQVQLKRLASEVLAHGLQSIVSELSVGQKRD